MTGGKFIISDREKLSVAGIYIIIMLWSFQHETSIIGKRNKRLGHNNEISYYLSIFNLIKVILLKESSKTKIYLFICFGYCKRYIDYLWVMKGLISWGGKPDVCYLGVLLL